MRSRKVYFKASRMKPKTKVYAFFNDVNVTAFCREEAYQEWSNTSNVINYSGATSHPGGSSGVLTTDNTGAITGSFIIPRNASIKFKTGTKEFRLSLMISRRKELQLKLCFMLKVLSNQLKELSLTLRFLDWKLLD
jgi:hypothetical protein